MVQKLYGPFGTRFLEITADRQAGGLLEASHQVALADTAGLRKIGNSGTFGLPVADKIDNAPELPG